jgi:hypothetical protein
VIVGVLRVDLAVFEAQSLKDRRRVIKSLKERLAARFNVSVAEVGASDSPKKAMLGMAVVGNESRFVQSCLDKIVDYVRRDPGASLIDYEQELF